MIKDAETLGCKVLGGLGMLVNQGITGIEYWTGVPVDDVGMRTHLEELFGAQTPSGMFFAFPWSRMLRTVGRQHYSIMKLGMINSAWEQHGVGLVDGLRKTKELGFDCVDIFEDPMEPQAEGRIAEIKRTCGELGLPIISVVGVSVGLVDFNPAVQRFHVERCKRYLDMGATFGAKNYLLVIGEYIWQKEVIPPEEQWKFAVENCKLLGDYAGKRDLEIVIELEPFHMSLVNTIGEMDRFLTDVDNPAVKANIDISHMVLSDSPPESLTALKGRAGHVHISDCDGKVHGDLPPGRGAVPFEGYLQAIKDLGFDGAISLELEYAPDPSQIVEWVTEAYSATDRLMSAINLRN